VYNDVFQILNKAVITSGGTNLLNINLNNCTKKNRKKYLKIYFISPKKLFRLTKHTQLHKLRPK